MTNLTPQNFHAEVARGRVLVCVHGGVQPPQDLEGLCGSRLKCCHLDAEAHEELLPPLKILRLPAGLLLENGRIIQRIQGAPSLSDYAKILNLD
jgi:hypothetical protein